MLNNRLTGNRAISAGGILCQSSSLVIADTVLSGNRASGNGGGFYNSSSSPTIANCTFSGNSATSGAGLYNAANNPSLTNCVFWGNNGPVITNGSGGPAVTYCDVQGGYAGTGNTSSDPRFVRAPGPGAGGTWGTADDDYGDLRLLAGSPCIDAGKNAAVPAGVVADLDGHGRFFNDPATADCPFAPGTCGTAAIVDMGAYEFIAGDYDRDGDLGADDLAVFLTCISGPAVGYAGDCLKADLDHDGDVDLGDFGLFQRCYSGANKPVEPNCAN